MKLAYYITPEHKIESDENGNFQILDLNMALATVAGWKLREITPLKDAMMVRNTNEGEQLAFIPVSNDMAVIEQHANTYGVVAFMPMAALDFAQALMQSYPYVPTAKTSENGALVGLWVIESVSAWQAANIMVAGVQHGVNEYTITQSRNLPEAISLNVLQRMGIGKKAYFYYPDMTVENGELIFLSERTINTVSQDAEFMARVVAAPELDVYAVIGAPEEALTEARSFADAQAVIQKEPLKQRQLEQEAAAAATAEGEAAPAPSPNAEKPVIEESPAQVESVETVEDFQG